VFDLWLCLPARTAHPATHYNQPHNPLPPFRKHIAARLTLALFAICLAAPAQQPVQQPVQQPAPRTLILLDPAHGGPDTGAHLDDHLLEKDVTLALATRLRAALATAGFAILSTRDTDPATLLPTDQRASIANHAHPIACLLLHATSSGTGIHIATSDLPETDEPQRLIPWDTAQSASIPQSLRLANELGVALIHARIPVLLTRASVRPLDNITCPAVAIEIAPLPNPGSDPTPVTDSVYQQHVAQAIAAALTSWRTPSTPTGAAR
jgi:N-acetylmuramoyl-L-alanine amidase